MRWLQSLLCRFGHCMQCRTAEDEQGIWGQCINCGKRHGYVDRATLRAYIDRESEGTTPGTKRSIPGRS